MEMRTAEHWLNPVKAGGMAAYFVALVSCGAASVWAVSQRISRLAAFLAILHAALFLDIAFDWRWSLYGWLKGGAIEHHWYDQRHWPQVAMLGILVVLLFSGIIFAWRRFRASAGVALAFSGALLSIACWATEIISLHGMDAILYYRVGPLMVISFVWMSACLITTFGILRAAKYGLKEAYT